MTSINNSDEIPSERPHSFGDYLAICDQKGIKPHFVLAKVVPGDDISEIARKMSEALARLAEDDGPSKGHLEHDAC